MARILHGYWRSSAAYRVRIALALKGLDYEYAVVDLRRGGQSAPGYRALNPQGLVPLLVEDGRAISQSLAIIEYLEEVHPEPPLLPRDPAARARVRALAEVVACDIHPINNLRVLRYLKQELGREQGAIDAWARHWIAAGFAALEDAAAGSGAPYLTGDAITLADVCLVPQVTNARRVETDLSPFPRLVEIDARLREHPAFAAADPARQPDAPSNG
ncbi:MAG: maleylacetoacetate isomerase [Novosphingobium sp.]|nr:maleylacetoacetate isomerase [Novosphingobium sp.]